jgi:replicative DNA helicase
MGSRNLNINDRQQKKNQFNTLNHSSLDRVAPNNIDAEEGLLASCIMDTGLEVISCCVEEKISPDYFFKPSHTSIYQAILDLYQEGSPIDEIILTNKLQSQNKLEQIGGYAAITLLTNRIETTAHFRYWLGIVREKCLLRRLIDTSTKIISRCYRSQDQLENLLEEAEQDIFSISQDRVSDSAKTIKESVDEASTIINAMLQRKGEIGGIPSGFTDLDKMTFGFHPQEMIVLAARPSIGKTSFAMNIAEHIILPESDKIKPTPTLVFSLEMSAEQLAMRLLCSHSKVHMKRIQDGFQNKQEEKALAQAGKELRKAPLWIDDAAQISILEMRAKARRVHAKNSLGLIIIDYLQLISGTDNRVHREQQIAEISRGIKAMAKELRLPVIVLSQLNRESEKERRSPRLSDLRESGSIEQDADVVLLLAKRKSDDDKDSPLEESGMRDLIIAKQRNGPIGKLSLTFMPEFTRFENYIKQDI